MSHFIQDKEFTAKNMDEISIGEYEQCHFSGIDFTQMDLSKYSFYECSFEQCNLSLVKMNRTGLRICQFIGCKLLGIYFDACNTIGFEIKCEDSILNDSSFTSMNIKGSTFVRCQMTGIDFTDSNLTNVRFDQCNLLNTTFDNTTLTTADLRTAIDYTIDPRTNIVKSAQFASNNLNGLLECFHIKIEN